MGDKISVGWRTGARWKTADREPIADFIKRRGKWDPLAVKSAFETTGKMSYNYMSNETASCPEAHLGGGLMKLECKQSWIKAVELLKPIYDLCARLPAPRIWYDRAESPSNGEYCIEEARAVFTTDKSDALLGTLNRTFVGTYYPSYAKILSTIEQLTSPGDWAQEQMRRMIREDAFYTFKRTGRRDEGANWRFAQERMAGRVIWCMNNNPWAGSDWKCWLNLSGQLETPNGRPSIDKLGRLSGADTREVLLPLLVMLKTDDKIHLVKADMPAWLYMDGVMTWSKHMPGGD